MSGTFKLLLFTIAVPMVGFAALTIVSVLTLAINGGCEPMCIPADHPIVPLVSELPGGTEIPLLLAAVAVVCFAIFIMHGLTHSRTDQLDVEADEAVPESDIEDTLTERNMMELEGWSYALQEGTITRDDLRTTEPAALQARIDAANPLVDELTAVLEWLPTYEGATSEVDKELYQELVVRRQQLREQPLEVHRKAVRPVVLEVIEGADKAIQSVQDLVDD